MLALLLPQGTVGFTPIPAVDTASLSGSEGDLSDFFTETLDNARLSILDSGAFAVTFNRSEFYPLPIDDVASIVIQGEDIVVKNTATGAQSFAIPLLFPQGAQGEEARLNLLDISDVFKTPSFFSGSDSASIAVDEGAQLSVGMEVNDTCNISLTDTGVVFTGGTSLISGTDTVSISVNDAGAFSVSLSVSDSASLSLTDTGSVFDMSIFQLPVNVSDAAILALSVEQAQLSVNVQAQDVCNLVIFELANVSKEGLVIVPTLSDNALINVVDLSSVRVAIDGTENASILLSDGGSIFEDPGFVFASDQSNISLGEAVLVFNESLPADTASLSLIDFGSSLNIAQIAKAGGDVFAISLSDIGISSDTSPVETMVFSIKSDAIFFEFI